MKSHHWLLPTLILLAAVGALHRMPLAAETTTGAQLDHLPVSELIVETASGERHRFRVYEARTPEQRSRGLMFVTDLAADEGMLFDSGVVEHATMWMRNTPLSLDMLFVLPGGEIGRIERETVPYSRKLIPSGQPVRAVVELNGGVAAELGIRAGDRVIHPLIGTADRIPAVRQGKDSRFFRGHRRQTRRHCRRPRSSGLFGGGRVAGGR